ncbi:MAG: arginase family protein [Thermodesulfobacteriota bacterium]|nr:arginase family protein [Thermodesulfobacteriota bacterium]
MRANMGNGARGAQRGPVALRASQAEYSPWGALTMAHTGTMVNPFSDMTIVDYGDAPHDPLSTMRTNEGVRAIVREITEVKRKDGSHVIPFIIGGDHSLAYPDIAAVTDVYGKGKVGVIHFDAHFDGTMAMGHLAGHGMWVRQLINEGFVPGKTIFKLDCEVIILMPEHSSGCVNRGFVITPWLRLMTVAGIS